MTTTKTSLLLIGVLLFAFGCKRGPLAAKNQETPAAPASPTAPSTPDPAAPATNAPSTTPATNTPAGFTVQGEPIADIPDYPNGTRVKYEIGGPKVGFSRSVETKFMTNDTFENVRAYYLKAIPENGWRIVGTQQKPGEIEWTLAKGTSVGEIEIDTERTGGVSISLERKDR